jgi:Ca2+-binding RTX toxin-like protein
MKSMSFHFPNFHRAVFLALGLCLGNMAWSKPSIQSVAISPNTLTIAQSFTVTVAASPDVTQATAVLDFLKGQPQFLEVPLTKQGSNWVGSGVVPLELRFEDPHKAEAKVRVLVLDVALRPAELTVRVPVRVPVITAIFAGGILTITGDDQDNTIICSRDAAGVILVNGGAVPVTGGVATLSNTTLIRLLGMGGNDILQVGDGSSIMPPAQILGGDGDDTLTGTFGPDELDGGPGNDTLIGRAGDDTLIGGPGNDTLTGGQGKDQMLGGEDDDQFVWNPGDASDVVEGQGGKDTLQFFGANIAELIDLSTNGTRLKLVRNIGTVEMDCAGLETVVVRPSGGTDQIVVNDLQGTEVAHVMVDLSTLNGTGDLVGDTVVVNGSETNDVIMVHGSTNGVDVAGLTATVTIVGIEPAIDELLIDARAGLDVVDASAMEAGAILLTLNGGLGNDKLVGGQGNDFLVGGRDVDEMIGGNGDDTFVWNPGDANDVIEGEAGNDTLLFNGANVAETVDIFSNGERVLFTRNIAGITMDCNEVETIHFNALGGADLITVHDLTGTDVTNVRLALQGSGGTNDMAADTVIVVGTAGNDVATISGTPAGVNVQGLSAVVNIVGSEPSLDQLIVLMLTGDDTATAAELFDGVISLTLNGGLGNDVLIGGAGADVLLGDEGDDVLRGGPGLDILDGGAGDNIVIQD